MSNPSTFTPSRDVQPPQFTTSTPSRDGQPPQFTPDDAERPPQFTPKGEETPSIPSKVREINEKINEMEKSSNHNQLYILGNKTQPLTLNELDETFQEKIQKMKTIYENFKTSGIVREKVPFVLNFKGQHNTFHNFYFYISISGTIFSIHVRKFFNGFITIAISIGPYHLEGDEKAIINCTIKPYEENVLHLDYFFYNNRELTKEVIPDKEAFLFYLLKEYYKIPNEKFNISDFYLEDLSKNFEKVKALLKEIKDVDLTKEQFYIDINIRTHIQSIGQRGMRLVKIIKMFTDTTKVVLIDAWTGKGGEDSDDVRRFHKKHKNMKALKQIDQKIEDLQIKLASANSDVSELKIKKEKSDEDYENQVKHELNIIFLKSDIEDAQEEQKAIVENLETLQTEIDNRGLSPETIKYWEDKLVEQDKIGRPDSLANGFYGLFEFTMTGLSNRYLEAFFEVGDITVYEPQKANPIPRLNHSFSKFTTRH